ncbi:MAG: histidinol-phosphate transaminase [Candidatus Methylarchaceae archaeon HK01M]|nr:histidinol-phosphate transaminase [Candidatus Methylarchaceae archaeon HK01M]
MKSSLENWLQNRLKEIRFFIKYVKPESVSDVALKAGIAPKRVIKLNQNENLFLSRELLLSLIDEVVNEIDPRVYPKEGEMKLRDSLGRYVGVSSDYITLGNGSDQIIDLILRTFLRKDDIAVSITPTYSMYKWSANHLGIKYLEIPLKDDFSLDVDGILESSNRREGICIICSPNNPTSNQFEPDDVLALIENFPGIVLLDEAYVEFAKESLVGFVKKHENLIVTRTFSKAFGLAGVRIGYAISNPEISTTISEYAQLPYSLNCIALRMPLKVLDVIDTFKESIERLKEEREKLVKRLNTIKSVTAFRSDANFILFTVKKPYEEVFDELLNRGVLVRKIGAVLNLRECLRATVGLPHMNESFIEALTSIS